MCVFQNRPGKYRYEFIRNGKRYSKAGFTSRIEAKEAEQVHKNQIQRIIGQTSVKQDRYFLEHRIRKQTQQAIQKGLLKRPPYCGDCGKPCKPYAHHDDYNKPLNVKWVCPKCHAKYYHHQFCKPKHISVKWPYAKNYH